MTRHKVNRKARFKAALALAGTTATAWAMEAGVSRQHLNEVLGEARTPGSVLNERIDTFIRQQEEKVRTVAA